MEVLHDAVEPARRLRRPTVAIGVFDGVHRGHRQLFATARQHAQHDGGETVVLTFDPPPAKILSPTLAPPVITSLTRKLQLIEQSGIDACVVQRFDSAFAALEPAEFIDRVIVKGLAAKRLVVGYDFSYGRARAGTLSSLAEAGRARGFELVVVPAFSVDGLVCSSTRVRQFVLDARFEVGALLLGRPYEMIGRVERGRQRGRTIGIPTANLALEMELLPPVGVYAGYFFASPASADTAAITPAAAEIDRRHAVINIGYAPTFESAHRLTVEVHVLDFDGDLYDQRVLVQPMHRLRGEQRFGSVPELQQQIARDIERARQLLA